MGKAQAVGRTDRANVRVPRKVSDNSLKPHSLACKLPEVIESGQHSAVAVWDETNGSKDFEHLDLDVDV